MQLNSTENISTENIHVCKHNYILLKLAASLLEPEDLSPIFKLTVSIHIKDHNNDRIKQVILIK